MKLNAYIIVGIIILAIGLTTVRQGGNFGLSVDDTTLPEYDATYMIPANNTHYTSLLSVNLVVRDLESGIQSVTLQITGSNFSSYCDLQRNYIYHFGDESIGWETWSGFLNPRPQTPGKYIFAFGITNGVGFTARNFQDMRALPYFYLDAPETTTLTTKLQVKFTINGEATFSQQALFQITGPNGYSQTKYANNLVLTDMPVGTYLVTGTYNSQVQTRTIDVTNGTTANITFNFNTAVNDSSGQQLPIEPTAYNDLGISPNQLLPISGVILIIGAIVLVMGFKKITQQP